MNFQPPILTIVIPTYNRSAFLQACIESIVTQRTNPECVEVIISDNASTDDTANVVAHYVQAHLGIRYIRNEINKGADANVGQAYKLGTADFVWVIGDDDQLLPDTLPQVLDIIRRGRFDLLYLPWRVGQPAITDLPLRLHEFTDAGDFFSIISHNVTFISSVIIHRIHVRNVDYQRYIGTSLPQLSYTLHALEYGSTFLYASRTSIGVTPDNSGGYKVCKVFGPNINRILEESISPMKLDHLQRTLNNRLIVECFPSWIRRIRQNINNEFQDEDNNLTTVLQPVFRKYLYYWLFLYPLLIVPKRFFTVTFIALKGPIAVVMKFTQLRNKFKLNFRPNSKIVLG